MSGINEQKATETNELQNIVKNILTVTAHRDGDDKLMKTANTFSWSFRNHFYLISN